MPKIDFLLPEHFYDRLHQRIFRAVLAIYANGARPDAIQVIQLLREKGDVGVREAIEGLEPGSGNITEYAALVHSKFLSRSIISLGEEAVERAVRQDPGVVLDSLEHTIAKLRPDIGGGFERLSLLARTTLGREASAVPSGFGPLDSYLGGLGRSRLVCLAARPAIGKTTLALNIAANVARSGKKVAFFSLEMSGPELAERLVVSETPIEAYRIKRKSLSSSEVMRIGATLYRMGSWELIIDDSPTLSTYEIAARAKRAKQERGLDLVVLDYLQLVAPPKAESRVQEVSEITRALKVLARELDCPILILSQLSRAVEMREKSGKPRLADLRDSGSIEQDSDQVVFLWREAAETDRYAETMCGVAKNRHGNTGHFVLRLIKEESRFVSY